MNKSQPIDLNDLIKVVGKHYEDVLEQKLKVIGDDYKSQMDKYHNSIIKEYTDKINDAISSSNFAFLTCVTDHLGDGSIEIKSKVTISKRDFLTQRDLGGVN